MNFAPSSEMPTPSISLVGAGPGDPELITLRGLSRIQKADVILTDSLVHPALLQHARDDAEIVDVGKIPGGPQTPQELTNQMLISEAQKGRRVVRLKGGDPFVFGRGSEEALACMTAGVAVEVVPGISSSVAGPAAAWVPVTHRGVSTHFTVITGHGGPSADGLQERWHHLAQAGGTLVFLMGVKHLALIQKTLLEAGRDDDTKVAIVQRASWESEEVCFTTLAGMVQLAETERVRSPAVIVVGDVVGIGENLMSLVSQLSSQPHLAQSSLHDKPMPASTQRRATLSS